MKRNLKLNNKNMLSELDWRTADSAYMKALKLSDSPNVSKYEAERRKNQADLFSKYSIDQCDKQYGVDKIKQREAQHNTDVALGFTKEPFKHTNGDLKRLDRQSNDANDYFSGKQVYKNGKWVTNESKKNTKMNKQIIRLTESDLKQMVAESTKKILSELDWKTYASAARKNDEFRANNPHTAHQWNRSYDFRNAAHDAFNKKYGLEGQYDKRYGGDKGAINLNSMDDFSISGSRDHDFGDGDPHGLRHNVYHMSKKYGKDGGYGRTRMWDYAHETTPEEFYGNNDMGKKFRDAEKDVEDFNSGKSHYVNGKGWSNESKKNIKMNKQIIRLTESDLHRIIEEFVKIHLNEIGDTPRGNFALNAVRGRAAARPRYHNDKYGSVNARAKQQRIASDASDKAWDNYKKNPELGFNNEAGYNYGYSKGVEK